MKKKININMYFILKKITRDFKFINKTKVNISLKLNT